VSPALAPPLPPPLHLATLPATWREGSPATQLLTAIFIQSRIFKLSCDDETVPPLPYEERAAPEARRVGFARKGEQPMSDDWKKSLPFPAHWLSYLSFKLIVLALATLVALRFWGVI
jgi:hypothetical protein